MKLFLVLTIFSFSFFVKTVEARSGCCSYHGGVCGCGCCDGTSLSSTCAPYYPECGGGYTYQAPPSCPIMSIYNSSSGQCECYSGYVASGNSCISVEQWCSNKYGYNSERDYSTSSGCKCRYGYVWNSSGTSCISQDQSCQNQYGYNSKATISGDQCECNYGYTWNSIRTKCISQNEECQNEYGYNSKASLSGDQCECNYGYVFNKERTKCITKDAACQELNGPMSRSGLTDECECLSGYEYNGSQCALVIKKNTEVINVVDRSEDKIYISPKPSIVKVEPTKTTFLTDLSGDTQSVSIPNESIQNNLFNKLFSQLFTWLFNKK